jgi:virulence-associated protein VapD
MQKLVLLSGATALVAYKAVMYVTEKEDMANLFLAIQELRALPWFPKSVRDLRAFRIEQWSDFTAVVKA